MAQRKTNPCSPCAYEEIHTPSSSYCKSCDEYLCQVCLGQHQKFSKLRGHTVVEQRADDTYLHVIGTTNEHQDTDPTSLGSTKSQNPNRELDTNLDPITTTNNQGSSAVENSLTTDHQGYVTMNNLSLGMNVGLPLQPSDRSNARPCLSTQNQNNYLIPTSSQATNNNKGPQLQPSDENNKSGTHKKHDYLNSKQLATVNPTNVEKVAANFNSLFQSNINQTNHSEVKVATFNTTQKAEGTKFLTNLTKQGTELTKQKVELTKQGAEYQNLQTDFKYDYVQFGPANDASKGYLNAKFDAATKLDPESAYLPKHNMGDQPFFSQPKPSLYDYIIDEDIEEFVPKPSKQSASGIDNKNDQEHAKPKFPSPIQDSVRFFEVEVEDNPFSRSCHIHGARLLRIRQSDLAFFTKPDCELIYIFPLTVIRRFSKFYREIYFEIGRRCPKGEGRIRCKSDKSADINTFLHALMKANPKAKKTT